MTDLMMKCSCGTYVPIQADDELGPLTGYRAECPDCGAITTLDVVQTTEGAQRVIANRCHHDNEGDLCPLCAQELIDGLRGLDD